MQCRDEPHPTGPLSHTTLVLDESHWPYPSHRRTQGRQRQGKQRLLHQIHEGHSLPGLHLHTITPDRNTKLTSSHLLCETGGREWSRHTESLLSLPWPCPGPFETKHLGVRAPAIFPEWKKPSAPANVRAELKFQGCHLAVKALGDSLSPLLLFLVHEDPAICLQGLLGDRRWPGHEGPTHPGPLGVAYAGRGLRSTQASFVLSSSSPRKVGGKPLF